MPESGGRDDDQPLSKRARLAGPYTFKVLCSDNVAANIIGSKGIARFRLQDETGAHLSFSARGAYFPRVKLRVLTIRGPNPEALAEVLDALVDRIDEEDHETECRVICILPHYAVSSLLGRGGSDVQRLQADTNCVVEVEKSALVENHQRVEVKGRPSEVKQCLRVVSQKVQGEVHRDWFPDWAAQDPTAIDSGRSVAHLGAATAQRRAPVGLAIGVAGGGVTACSRAGRGTPRGGSEVNAIPLGRRPMLPESQEEDFDFDGPSPRELDDFRHRFPVDDKAWSFFSSCTAATQLKVIQDFEPKPLRPGAEDYSAMFTSFVAKVANSGGPEAKIGKRPVQESRGGSRRGSGDPAPSEPPLISSGRGGGRGAPADVAPKVASSKPERVDDSLASFTTTFRAMPRLYTEREFSIQFELDEETFSPLEGCLDDVEAATRTEIMLEFVGENEPRRRVCITGQLPDVYTAHLQLMRTLMEGLKEEREIQQDDSDKVREMQDQIAQLQAQLSNVKRSAPAGAGGGRGRGRGGPKSRGRRR